MVYLTGDIHGPLSVAKFSSRAWPEGKELTRDDYVIILGDFGLVWDDSMECRYWLKWLESKPWTTLFIDGNHENHAMLATYPEREWHGGMVHEIRPHVLHLMRGYVFDIDDKTFLAMGGAHSHDVEYRTEGVSWWPEEVPSDEERLRCEDSLSEHGWSVDYVLTHDAMASATTSLACVSRRTTKMDEYEEWLDTIAANLEYKRWYCGHWHMDVNRERLGLRVLYHDIIRAGE